MDSFAIVDQSGYSKNIIIKATSDVSNRPGDRHDF